MIDEPIPTALFFDCDNVFGSLHQLEPRAADAFVTKPEDWLRFFEVGLHALSGSQPRRILLRYCHINPDGVLPAKGAHIRFDRFRKNFANAAFSVADCPSLTKGGKSAADTVMIMDIMDALRHETRFADFIVMSGDADFIHVLLRLRAHDRRTVAVAQTDMAKAYRAGADEELPHDVFVAKALSIAKPAAKPAAPALVKPETIPDPVHTAILQAVSELLAKNGGAVELSRLGQDVRDCISLPEGRIWPGLKAFLAKSGGPGIQLRTGDGGVPIFAFDPKHYQPAVETETAPVPTDRDMDPLADILRTVRGLLRDSGADTHLSQLTRGVREFLLEFDRGDWPGGQSLREILERSGDPAIGLKRTGPKNMVHVFLDEVSHEARLAALAEAVRNRVAASGWMAVGDLPDEGDWFGFGSARA
jgi:hypothetical protein